MNFELLVNPSAHGTWPIGEMSWLRKVLRLGSRARIAGTDLNGNQYFETEARGIQSAPSYGAPFVSNFYA